MQNTSQITIFGAMCDLLAAGFMYRAPGISMSRPAMMDVLCVAPQSDMTYLGARKNRRKTSHGVAWYGRGL